MNNTTTINAAETMNTCTITIPNQPQCRGFILTAAGTWNLYATCRAVTLDGRLQEVSLRGRGVSEETFNYFRGMADGMIAMAGMPMMA